MTPTFSSDSNQNYVSINLSSNDLGWELTTWEETLCKIWSLIGADESQFSDDAWSVLNAFWPSECTPNELWFGVFAGTCNACAEMHMRFGVKYSQMPYRMYGLDQSNEQQTLSDFLAEPECCCRDVRPMRMYVQHRKRPGGMAGRFRGIR